MNKKAADQNTFQHPEEDDEEMTVTGAGGRNQRNLRCCHNPYRQQTRLYCPSPLRGRWRKP